MKGALPLQRTRMVLATGLVALVACSNGPQPDRVAQRPAPKIITSDMPPPVRPPPPVPEAEPYNPKPIPPPKRIVDPSDQQFFDYPDGYDAEYDEDSTKRANDALDLIMGSTVNPFGKHGGATEVDSPPNQPPERAVRTWDDGTTAQGHRTCRNLILYSAPSETSGMVTSLPSDTQVKPTGGEQGDWIFVDAGKGRTGWALRDAIDCAHSRNP